MRWKLLSLLLFLFFSVILNVQAQTALQPIWDGDILVPDGDPLETLTQIFGFRGCSANERRTVLQAASDAMTIASAVGKSDWAVEHIKQDSWQTTLWWERENLKRMRQMKDHWSLGDWWNGRYIEIRCRKYEDLSDIKGRNCRNSAGIHPPHAHTVAAGTVGNKYDTICLCDGWFDDLVSFREKVIRMDGDPVYNKSNLLSLKTQGSVFLHEMLHTAYDPKKNLGGLTFPGANVDNYVYYALFWYVYDRWGVWATGPEAHWKFEIPRAQSGEESEDSDLDDGANDFPGNDVYQAVYNPVLFAAYAADPGLYYGRQPCIANIECEASCPPEYKAVCSEPVERTTVNAPSTAQHQIFTMGTRHIVCIWYKGRFVIAQYGHWDGHPEGAGVDVLEFITPGNIERLKAGLRFVKAIPGPCEGKSLGAGILELVADAGGIVEASLDLGFASNGLFCEWAYVVDLDAEVLEVYSGGSGSGRVVGECRFAQAGVEQQVLKGVFAFAGLPNEDDFVRICKEGGEYDGDYVQGDLAYMHAVDWVDTDGTNNSPSVLLAPSGDFAPFPAT
ncbi:hypothetical protein Q7P37_006865 [Cladosporium fusiforme]